MTTIRMQDLNERLNAASLDDRDVVLEAIEALKRWIYGAEYRGPQKEPVPEAEEEFSRLLDGLRRWATLYAPHTDTGRLQDYRRAELTLAAARGPGRVFRSRRSERDWRQAAHKADDALNELKILLIERSKQQEDQPKGQPGRRGYPLEALAKARELRSQHPNWKVERIRGDCLKLFGTESLPQTADAFRRWMTRRRKRTNRAN